MDTYNEVDQLALIKAWWKKNGFFTTTAIAIMLIGTFGWHYWQAAQEAMLRKSSVVYERLLDALANNDITAGKMQANRLMEEYPRAPYAQAASLILARYAVNQHDFSEAENRLNWAIHHGHDAALKQLARIRMARLMMAEQKPQDALRILDHNEDTSFSALVDEAKGDAYQQMGQFNDAKKAYRDAISTTPDMDILDPLLQIKIDNLN